MIAIVVFAIMYLFGTLGFIYRNKVIDGIEATKKVDDVAALAHWESMIIESKTAKEKMVYMRLADEAKAKIMKGVNKEIAKHEPTDKVEPIFNHSKPPAKVSNKIEPSAQPANVVSLMDRKKTGS